MPIDHRLPALRRRRSALAVKVTNQQDIIDAAQMDEKGVAAFAYQIQNAQAEFDELEFVIEHFEHYAGDDKPKIPIHVYTFIAAFLLWASVTIAAWVVFAR